MCANNFVHSFVTLSFTCYKSDLVFQFLFLNIKFSLLILNFLPAA